MKKIITFVIATLSMLVLTSKVSAQAGTLDTSFGTNGIASIIFQSGDFKMYDSKVQSDGKILCFGKFFVSTSNGFFPTVVRLNANGSGIDFSFANNGVQILSEQLFLTDLYLSMSVDSQGNIYTAATSGSNINVYKLSANGSIDLSFGSSGMVEIVSGGRLADLVLQADGKIVVASTSNNDFVIARLNSNGTMDSGFGVNGLQTHSIFGIDIAFGAAIQSDGKILVCGTTDNGFGSMLGIIRLNTNGSLDNSFGLGGKVSRIITGSDFAYSIAVTSSGKVITAGRTTNGIFNQRGLIAQFNADGSEDSNFGTNGLVEIQLAGNADFFSDILIQPDGKILATGIHNINGTNSSFLIARLNSDGSPDVGFGSTNDGTAIASFSGIDLHGLSISLNSNGDAYIGGAHQGDNAIRVAKFNTGLALSTTENHSKTLIKSYPNPTFGIIFITVQPPKNNLTYSIFNMTGQLIKTETFFHHNNYYSIDISELKSGSYILKVSERAIRVVKQ